MSPSALASPRIVVTMGIYRSASTWVANIVAEILRLGGPAEIIVADSVAEMARHIGSSSSAFVVKTHRPDPSMRCLIRLSGLPVVLTVRDPPDCVASLINAFGERFENARSSVSLSCESILRTVPFCRPLTLFYEGSLARDAACVGAIATYLGVALTDTQAEDIADRFGPDAVKRLIERMTEDGVFGHDPKPYYADAATQWHPGHVGSGHSGRHREILTAEQLDQVRHATQSFEAHFSYPTDSRAHAAEARTS